MLQKIISIKNVGKFSNSTTPGNPQLAKYTFVLGANGYGKTTLCSILRSAQTGDGNHVIGRKRLTAKDPPTIELLLKGNTVSRFDGKQWDTPIPGISIFDGLFVHENVHAGHAPDLPQKRNLYRVVIGREGLRLIEEEAELTARQRQATSNSTVATTAIRTHVPTGMALDAFLKLQVNPNIVADIVDQTVALDAIRQAQQIKDHGLLSLIPVPALPHNFETLLSQTISGIERNTEALLKQHLAKHRMTQGETWIVAGMKHSDADACPFCGRDGLSDLQLFAAYKGIFSEGYKKLKEDLASAKQSIEAAFGDRAIGNLTTTIERNNTALEFWQHFVPIDADFIAVPSCFDSAVRNLGVAAIALIEKKLGAPLEPLAPDQAFGTAKSEFDAACSELIKTNAGIEVANGAINKKKTETTAADVKGAEARLTLLKATQKRHEPQIANLCKQYSDAQQEKSAIEARKTAVRTDLDKHSDKVIGPYEQRINTLLDNFNAGFRIAKTGHTYAGGVATSNYQLVINNVAVEIGDGSTPDNLPSFKNTLSAGDKATLALAFFIADLERDPNLGSKVVVFDDPFNSQDAFRRTQTMHEIEKIGDACAQVIVMSHDAQFLKTLWEKCPPSDRQSINLCYTPAEGSKIMAIELDKTCIGRVATERDDLLTFHNSRVGGLADVAKKMRVVLETHCRLTFPGQFLDNDWLGNIVGKIRTGGATHPAWPLFESLDQINEYSKSYHHGSGKDGDDAGPLDATELGGYVRRTLMIVNAIQP